MDFSRHAGLVPDVRGYLGFRTPLDDHTTSVTSDIGIHELDEGDG
jgi:hypothetical protein